MADQGKGGKRRKQFKFGFIVQHKKTILKIEFQKLGSRLNIFAIYQT